MVVGQVSRALRRASGSVMPQYRCFSAASSGSKGVLPKSKMAERTMNPIRRIVDQLDVTPNPEKAMIPLSIGDPTTFGNFNPPDYLLQRLEMMARQRAVPGGYVHSCGSNEAKVAVARKFSPTKFPIMPDDVYLTCGCSQALYLAIAVLVNPGENILLPRPAFPLYGNYKVFENICSNPSKSHRFQPFFTNNN